MEFDLDKEVSNFELNAKNSDDFAFGPSFTKVSEALAASTLNILNDDIFETFKELIYYIPNIKEMGKISSLYFTLTTSFQAEIEIINSEGFEIDVSEHKQVLYYYVYLLYGSVKYLIPLLTPRVSGKAEHADDKKRSVEAERKRINSVNTILSSILTTLCELLNQQLTTILQGQQKCIEFCDVILKSAHSIISVKESIKEKSNRNLLVNIFCLTAKNFQQNDQVSQRLTLLLPFSEHLAEPIAEILSTSVKTFDNKNLLQDVLVSCESIKMVRTNLAKNISILLIKLSELLGSDLVQFICLFQGFENSTPTIRAALMISYGNCVNSLSTDQNLINQYQEDIEALIETLEVRLLETHQIVRQRSFQALELIHGNDNSKLDFKEYRFRWLTYGLRHLEDKSSFVRKAAIGLLKVIIRQHPYTVDEGKLSWKFYWDNYVEYTKLMKSFNNGINYNLIRRDELTEDNLPSYDYRKVLEEDESSERYKSVFAMVPGAVPDEDDNMNDNVSTDFTTNLLRRKYCRDACIFIKLLNESFAVAATLLSSKLKSDSIAAIEYFTVGDAYKIDSARPGIKQMLHLIWKGGNEDGNRVVEKLIDAYVSMFLTPYVEETEANKIVYVATSLIKLTYDCNMTDLISLEKMVIELCKGREVEVSKKEKESKNYVIKHTHWITPQVISAIWHSFVKFKHFKEKKGAIIMISMIALHDYKIAYGNIDLLLKYGLNLNDLNYQIGTFTCVALRRVIPKKLPPNYIYPDFKPAIEKLKHILLIDTVDGDWYNLAEEALNTLYEIDNNSDDSATEVLKAKALSVFSESDDNDINKTASLSQLLFLLGHIAIKTIIYLEKCEADFKRKKQDYESKKNEQEMELDLIGGTNEDEIADVVQNIKEKELLYGSNSILAKFYPLVIEIIKKPKQYDNPILQRQATLCFAKFMCLSSVFCEHNLGLYLNILKRSNDSIIRSNLVLGLGDISVCFTNIIDENKSALYSQLQDKDLAVQRTCLMTVTFLILAGQIKVKGQLSQLAKLLVHEDKGLREMSKLFFQELATKDNAIYNGFIEMLSGLNLYLDDPNPKEEPFPFNKFKDVIKFVLPFINKERQRSLLIKKLDSRLKTCSTNERIRFCFCLKELIKKEDTPGTKKDASSEKSKYYKEILDRITTIENGTNVNSS